MHDKLCAHGFPRIHSVKSRAYMQPQEEEYFPVTGGSECQVFLGTRKESKDPYHIAASNSIHTQPKIQRLNPYSRLKKKRANELYVNC